MASIGLPQESRHPSYLSIDLYSTTLNLRFVSTQKSADDSRPMLDCPPPEASAPKVAWHGSLGLWSSLDVPAMLRTGVLRVRRRHKKTCLQE